MRLRKWPFPIRLAIAACLDIVAALLLRGSRRAT
jgi:hypothetical protein